jgi:hypothetical protein
MTDAMHELELTVRPDEDDARTIDGVIAAMYAALSGPAGAPRDWVRFFDLFVPGALLVPVTPRAGGERTVVTFDPQSYARDRAPIFERDGFYEHEIARRERRYGALAHVWSAYEARLTPDGPLLLRGANSLQLVHDRGRWWIVSALWERESPLHPLPPELLGRAVRGGA